MLVVFYLSGYKRACSYQ